ncbi:MAG: HlyD family efflux transporter periplasmic adaptor subunit [Burkholderiales bacterium]|nr:HlyD family efflux transporter periplasmic adaptor subunit [Burkholderiales bacterium]OJX06355.1 MAG: hypothetical protein BGO72_10540 [Burkholderiales bacterium 70-64]
MKIPRFGRRTVLTIALAALAAAGLAFGFRTPAPLVDTAEVVRGPFRVFFEEEGRTRVKDLYEVSAPIAGRLRRVQLEPGDQIAPGDLLFTIEPLVAAPLDARALAQAQASLERAEAALNEAGTRRQAEEARAGLATAELARIRPLAADGHVSKSALDRARTEADGAAAALRSARFAVEVARHERDVARAAFTSGRSGAAQAIRVTSPIEATVLKRLRQSEGTVASGTTVLTLGDLDSLEVEVDVLSPDAVRLSPGTPVELERWGGDGVLPGRVRRIEPAGFTKVSALGVEEQRVWVIVELDGAREAWRRLGDAYRVEARFVVWQGDDVLQVPAAALFREGERWGVYVLEGGRARYRAVTPGRRSGLLAEVAEGLAAGEQVLLHPGQEIADDVRVRPRRHAAGS